MGAHLPIVSDPPAPVPFTFEGSSDTVYLKRDSCIFGIDRDAVPLRQDSTYSSYEAYWSLPGSGLLPNNDAGGRSIRRIRNTKVVVENVCSSTITLRVQRPLGYLDETSAIAAWEPVGKGLLHEVAPHTKWAFTINHTSTNIASPRLLMRDGRAVLHIMSFSAYREPESDTGERVSNAKQTGLSIQLLHEYEATDPTAGDVKNAISIVTYDGDSHLDHVDPPPCPTVRVSTLQAPEGPVSGLAFFPTLGNTTEFKGYSQRDNIVVGFPTGKSLYHKDLGPCCFDPLGLDKTTVYCLPSTPPFTQVGGSGPTSACYTSGYIYWANDDQSGNFVGGHWNLAMFNGDQSAMLRPACVKSNNKDKADFTHFYQYTYTNVGRCQYFSCDELLFPAANAHDVPTPGGPVGSERGERRVGPHCRAGRFDPSLCRTTQLKVHLAASPELVYLPAWIETVISVVRTIVKVMKTVIKVAGALGLAVALASTALVLRDVAAHPPGLRVPRDLAEVLDYEQIERQ